MQVVWDYVLNGASVLTLPSVLQKKIRNSLNLTKILASFDLKCDGFTMLRPSLTLLIGMIFHVIYLIIARGFL
jgi:hypothetical protein